MVELVIYRRSEEQQASQLKVFSTEAQSTLSLVLQLKLKVLPIPYISTSEHCYSN